MSDGVVSEVEVFEMDAAFGLSDVFEQVLEFLLSGSEEHDAVVMGKGYALFSELSDDERIRCLCLNGTSTNPSEGGEQEGKKPYTAEPPPAP